MWRKPACPATASAVSAVTRNGLKVRIHTSDGFHAAQRVCTAQDRPLLAAAAAKKSAAAARTFGVAESICQLSTLGRPSQTPSIGCCSAAVSEQVHVWNGNQ